MTDNTFFEEQEEQSRIKAQIVSKYFWAWAKVVMPRVQQPGGGIVYMDLFAGRGRYADGSPSTPLLVLEKAVRDAEMCRMLTAVFWDADEDNVRILQAEIDALADVGALTHRPSVRHRAVCDDSAKLLEMVCMFPTLLFVDPWGYKGVSRRLLNAVLKDWGSECILFFNYRRINMALQNPKMRDMMDDLFGRERVDQLRAEVEPLDSDTRELVVVERFMEALAENRQLHVIPFRFRDARGTRTCHHLFFMTKNVLGYTIMKDIMAKESSGSEQGVAQFEYNPATRNFPMLFEYNRPLDDLGEMLLSQFAGQSLRMEDVYQKHQVGTPFVKKNYKSALANLEAAGKIVVVPPASERRHINGNPTFADDVVIQFPVR